MNSQTREKALNALRQLMDMLAKDDLPGLYLVVTGTRDFYEGYKGLKGLAPLHQRVHVDFTDDPQWDNLRAPQVRLLSFPRTAWSRWNAASEASTRQQRKNASPPVSTISSCRRSSAR